MRVNDLFEAGVIYSPYIPLQYGNFRISEKTRRIWRRQDLMGCPSAPYSCTGDCGSPEHMKRIEKTLKQEFGE